MDKRFFVAVLLAIGVLFLTPKLFPPAPSPAPPADADSAMTAAAPNVPAVTPVGTRGDTRGDTRAGGPMGAPVTAPPVATTGSAAFRPETATVVTAKATFRFTSAGGSLIGASLTDYMVLPKHEYHVELARPGSPIIAYQLLRGGDTVDLRHVEFHADPSPPQVVSYHVAIPSATMSLQYTFVADSYLVRVSGSLKSADTIPARLAVMMPKGLASSEADTLDDQRSLAYTWKPLTDDAETSPFTTVVKKGLVPAGGPFDWVASKSKYFLLAVIAPPKGELSGPALFSAPPSDAKVPAVANGEVIVTPDAQGRFAFAVYAGPQQWRRLVALGHGLQNANPVGGFMRSVMQPIATLTTSVLLWMHDAFKLNYGWVLVIFGVALRLILWPLNQSAMRSSLRMQRVQPELQALQAKYKDNPEKMHAEYMKLLASHGMTPFSQFTGCLPMLIPMPVLLALFFVFRNTIEFRGVPFLWLTDISLKDPYYILPVLMGISMFVLSWVGLRSAPPNPQAKMMGYMMPGMMFFFFMNLPAGLNLYYAVQNLTSLPQQWLISKERAKNPAPAAAPSPAPRK